MRSFEFHTQYAKFVSMSLLNLSLKISFLHHAILSKYLFRRIAESIVTTLTVKNVFSNADNRIPSENTIMMH